MAGPDHAYVWVWLPCATDPVVAGRLDDHGEVITFTYGRSYLDRHDTIPLFLPELPLVAGEHLPISGRVAGCIADAGPDAWGQRVIEHHRALEASDLGVLAYLMESGSDRIGALDFQEASDIYVARTSDDATLDDLVDAAERIERGEPLPPALDQALLHGSSVGGARPKSLLCDGTRRMIAKFSSTADPFPIVKAEYLAMDLARRVGLDVATVHLTDTHGKDVLLVDRFDRTTDGGRRLMVSALTILELHDVDGMAGRSATYSGLAHQIRARFTNPDATLRELFSRITFNVLVGNTDDHARNHAGFWDGESLELTPAYDICPQTRTGGEAYQAMAYGGDGPDGERASQVARCVRQAATYHLDPGKARSIVGHQIDVIRSQWDDACELAKLTTNDRRRLRGRQFLNEYALAGFSSEEIP